jgi:hypothetical protein
MVTLKNVSHNVSSLLNTYRQAPWRTQRQMIGIFLAALAGVTMVAAVYLSVTAEAAIIGRRIQNMEANIIAQQRINSDLETRLAGLTSYEKMESRALALGYQPAKSDELEYLPVPGYQPSQAVMLAPQPQLMPPAVPPQYTQTLLDWFDEQMRASAMGGAQ